MHRTITVPQPSFAPAEQQPGPAPRAMGPVRGGAALALGLLLALWPAATRAQGPPSSGIIVQVNGTELRQMTTKKRIKNAAVSNPLVVQVTAVNPTTVAIVGLAPGISTITLTDEADKSERLDVVVVAYDMEQLRSALRGPCRRPP